MHPTLPFSCLGTHGFFTAGGDLTSSLILQDNDPVLDLEITPKRYVVNKITHINASKLISGNLHVNKFPKFTGDVVNNAGDGTVHLPTSTVGTTICLKPNIDSKGVVVGNTTLVSSDIPDLDWGKITSGKPSTLGGYNISDCLNKIGGTSVGYITTLIAPSATKHAVTKQYVDTVKSLVPNLVRAPGDIFTRSTTTTPTGFLRCNGGSVSKTTYAVLYAAIGNTFGSTTTNFNIPNYLSRETSTQYFYIKY